MSKKKGYGVFPPNHDEQHELLEFIIVTDEERVSFFFPTASKIEKACYDYGLPTDEVFNIIDRKASSTHTILILREEFLSYLEERGKDK